MNGFTITRLSSMFFGKVCCVEINNHIAYKKVYNSSKGNYIIFADVKIYESELPAGEEIIILLDMNGKRINKGV